MSKFIHQKPRNTEFLLSEANGQRSRENIVMAPTETELYSGQLLALNDSGQHVAYTGPKEVEGEPPTFEKVAVVGVLYAAVPASDVAQQAVKIARDAEVDAHYLIGVDDDAEQSLAGLGLIVRN